MKALITTREICLIGIFTALTVILSQIAIPLPFTPVPLSMGIMAVYITGILLTPKCALFSQICYLALGIVGLPVFHNFQGGPGIAFGPTGGYLLAYPLMALIISFSLSLLDKAHNAGRAANKILTPLVTILSMLFANVVLYVLGTAWLSTISAITFQAALAVAVYPFVLLDLVKLVLCVALILPARRRIMAIGTVGSAA